MARWLCIEVRFLTGRYHGQRLEGREADWPPAPHRLFQALVAAAHLGERTSAWSSLKAEAFRWLERRPAPEIRTPPAGEVPRVVLSVPNNDMDLIARAWARGETPQKEPSKLRTMKTLRPVVLGGDATARFLWPIVDDEWEEAAPHVDVLVGEARHLHHLGLGIDLVAGGCRVLDDSTRRALPGEVWLPDGPVQSTRAPTDGSLTELDARYAAFRQRVSGGFVDPPVPPVLVRSVGYRRRAQAPPRRFFSFSLAREDGALRSFDARKVVHVAAWLRHAAHEAAKSLGFDDAFVESFVCGHGNDAHTKSRRLSYLPLPSIGHAHIDGRIRRALLVEPPGDGSESVRSLARSLEAAALVDLDGHWMADLRTVRGGQDGVLDAYLATAKTWGSVTPVVLPGHDDRHSRKAVRLVLKALAQAGCTTPVEEISLQNVPAFPGAERADRYVLPSYMQGSPCSHVTITFSEPLRGPLAVGRGRHVGLGILAPLHGA